jgi:hypothetical protein
VTGKSATLLVKVRPPQLSKLTNRKSFGGRSTLKASEVVAIECWPYLTEPTLGAGVVGASCV